MHIRNCVQWFAVVCFLSIGVPAFSRAAVPLRSEYCLNGTWKLQVDGVDQPAEVRVPGSYAGQDRLWGHDHWDVWGYPKAWYGRAAVYSKTFVIPETLPGRRVLIHFGGIRHLGHVEVNGVDVGGWIDPFVPFDLDITDAVRAGENMLCVYVTDDKTSGLFEDDNWNRRGIYRDVLLRYVPEVRVTPDIFVQTLLSAQTLACRVPVRNDSAEEQTVSLRLNVTDAAGRVAKRWTSGERVTLAPGEEKTINVSCDWNNPHLWSIDDPYLYHLETEVVDARKRVLDCHRLRFGFREITWDGPHLYLNGNELFLRGHGGHPSGDLQGGREYSRAWIRQLKAQGVELMRLHNLPRHAELYDVADEMGFLLISEASHHFRMPPETLARTHMENLVKWLRNHPSVLMWSVANELHWRNIEEPAYLIERCHELDPTRPAFNSDFSGFSLHGDVLGKHYDAANVWNDWEKYGPDKAMIWDEIGNVWQHDRPLKPGPAGYEISSQDVAAGTWRDGWEQLRSDIQHFADGRAINGEFHRVNAYVPWEFSYVFYRYQPFNNFQRFYPQYDRIEGARGIKPLFINPCSTTHNIWDPTLPEFQPNAGLFCFNEYLARVRFPDDARERTFFSAQRVEQHGRLFYEDHRPADRIEFRVETPDGKLLSAIERDLSLEAGAYVPEFTSEWRLPEVDSVTPIRLVRQFSFKGKTGYRKISEARVFPPFRPVDLIERRMAVIGTPLQKLFGGAGVPVSEARIIVAESFDPAWEAAVAGGVRVLVQPFGGRAGSHQVSHLSLAPKGAHQVFTGSIEQLKLPAGLILDFGTPAKEQAALTDRSFNIENPVPGAWVTFDFSGTMDFSTTGLIQLDYGLWTPPDDVGYNKPFDEAGGAPFFRKTVRPMLADSSGRWFVCSREDEGEMTRAYPTALYGSLFFDCLLLEWKPVGFESGAVVETGDAVEPDFSRVSAVGFVFGDTNPGSPVQMNVIQMRGGAEPGATVQPGAATHRLLAGLGQADFSFWRGGSSVQSLPLPTGHNVRRLLFGNKDGEGAALQECFVGRGVILESALNINRKEPAAGFMLNRMVDYLDQYVPGKSASGVAASAGDAFGEWLAALGVDHSENGRIFAVDGRNAERVEALKPRLESHLAEGGTVLFSEITPESIESVREVCRQPLRLTEPFFGQRIYCIKAPVSWARVGTPHEWVDYYDGILAPYPFEPNYSPLLAGIANLDLDWKRTPMFSRGIEIEGMNPVSANPGYQILISNWHIGSEGTDHLYGENLNGVRDLRQNSWFVNRDPVVLELPVGNGRVIFSQLDLAAGGDKAERIMQTLLTNLGVSFNGAMPLPAEAVYDTSLRADQLARFAVYDRQIDPVRREHYGIPYPMPDYLKATRIGAPAETIELPLLGFFADPLTLGLADALSQKLADVVRMDKPVVLQRADGLRNAIAGKKYARVVFSMGESELDAPISPADFRMRLEAVWKVLDEHAQKVYWVPIPAANGSDPQRAAKARAFNRIAETFFEGRDVYMLPFVYADKAALPPGYLTGDSRRFAEGEANVLADRLGEAVISFGAQ